MADPLFAFLVARIVEHKLAVAAGQQQKAGMRAKEADPFGLGFSALSGSGAMPVEQLPQPTRTAPFAHRSGFLLGPVSRSILKTYIVPDLMACAAGRPAGIAYPIPSGADRRALLLLAAMWTQEASLFRDALGACMNGGGIFCCPAAVREGDDDGGRSPASVRSVPSMTPRSTSAGAGYGHNMAAGGAAGSGQDDSGRASLSIRDSITASRDGLLGLLSAFPTFTWCLHLRPALVPAGCLGELFCAMDGVLRSQGLPEVQLQAYAYLLRRSEGRAVGTVGPGDSAFDCACRAALGQWRSHRAAKEALALTGAGAEDLSPAGEDERTSRSGEVGTAGAAGASGGALRGDASAAPAEEEEVDEDVRRAQERLQRSQLRERQQQEREDKEAAEAPTPAPRGGGMFNLAYEPTQRARPAADSSVTAAPAQRSIFDAFDIPPPVVQRPRPAPAAAPRNMLDMFDVPVPVEKPPPVEEPEEGDDRL